MTEHRRTRSALDTRQPKRRRGRSHRLPVCPLTGAPTYRDGHQAADAISAIRENEPGLATRRYRCTCGGWHVETTARDLRLPGRKRRLFLVDARSVTLGGSASFSEARAWFAAIRQVPGIAATDRMLIGGPAGILHRYRAAINGNNVEWALADDAAALAALADLGLPTALADFDEFVIASGDAAFVELAETIRAAGRTVHVVTVESTTGMPQLSRRLASVAHVRTLVRRESRRALVEPIAA